MCMWLQVMVWFVTFCSIRLSSSTRILGCFFGAVAIAYTLCYISSEALPKPALVMVVSVHLYRQLAKLPLGQDLVLTDPTQAETESEKTESAGSESGSSGGRCADRAEESLGPAVSLFNRLPKLPSGPSHVHKLYKQHEKKREREKEKRKEEERDGTHAHSPERRSAKRALRVYILSLSFTHTHTHTVSQSFRLVGPTRRHCDVRHHASYTLIYLYVCLCTCVCVCMQVAMAIAMWLFCTLLILSYLSSLQRNADLYPSEDMITLSDPSPLPDEEGNGDNNENGGKSPRRSVTLRHAGFLKLDLFSYDPDAPDASVGDIIHTRPNHHPNNPKNPGESTINPDGSEGSDSLHKLKYDRSHELRDTAHKSSASTGFRQFEQDLFFEDDEIYDLPRYSLCDAEVGIFFLFFSFKIYLSSPMDMDAVLSVCMYMCICVYVCVFLYIYVCAYGWYGVWFRTLRTRVWVLRT